MSLVHEALRKAEREKQRKAGAATSAPLQPAPPPPAQTHVTVVHAPVPATAIAPAQREAALRSQIPTGEQPRGTSHFLLPVLIGCVAIVAIIAIVFLVSNASSVLRQTKENVPAAATSATPVPVAQSIALAAPSAGAPPVDPPTADSTTATSVPPSTTPTLDDSKYKISGIMKDPDGKPVAVINGHVTYEGYYVDGATVDKIEADRVTLDIKGQKGVLRLH